MRNRSLPTLADLTTGSLLLASLPSFLRRQISLEEARGVVFDARERRQERFLQTAHRAIWQRGNPYRALMAHAGCEYGDLARLTRQEGVEGALRQLARAGAYLTVDELKGRRPAVRGSTSIQFGLRHLRNGSGPGLVAMSSSGSRGSSSVAALDLTTLRTDAYRLKLILAARGEQDWPLAIWGVPGSFAIRRLLDFGVISRLPPSYFAQVDPRLPGLHGRYWWSLQVLRLGFALAGRRLPAYRLAPLDDPTPLAHWAAAELRAGRTPLVWSHMSPAVRLCQAAAAAGIDLQGLRMSVGGEPCSPARLAALRRVGVDALPHYATVEAGLLAYGCLQPEVSDDLHLLDDVHALIQSVEAGPLMGLEPDALLYSSVEPAARFFLLNVSLGDRAELTDRDCGCELAALGYRRQIRHVRSFEKVTSGGMTFHDADLVHVLEQLLPDRFGGGPLDYQLVEEEAQDGQPRLRVRVDPVVGEVDLETVAEAFLEGIGQGSGAERVMATQWRQSGWLRAERARPFSNVSGKVLHVYRHRRA